jgi:hypothetical protein
MQFLGEIPENCLLLINFGFSLVTVPIFFIKGLTCSTIISLKFRVIQVETQ